MTLSFYTITIDAHDLAAQARFRCRTLDGKLLFEADALIA